ncbi:hypothetical protein E3N88_26554 [Mikania micrantha]|uniref:Uncharacterized protein n=1 Tax=Mikania micrantha TaxID=192012 RepID=A0A5N6MU33_9ASTR|nr:hypothetical protein E3N88_26554 [Mikania micrantha]
MAYTAVNVVPTVSLIRFFSYLVKNEDWFTIQRHGFLVDTPRLEAEFANLPFVPSWNVTNKDFLSDPVVCRNVVKEFVSHGQRLVAASMDDEALRDGFATQWAQFGSFLPKICQRWAFSFSTQEKSRTKLSIEGRAMLILERKAFKAEEGELKFHANQELKAQVAPISAEHEWLFAEGFAQIVVRLQCTMTSAMSSFEPSLRSTESHGASVETSKQSPSIGRDNSFIDSSGSDPMEQYCSRCSTFTSVKQD